MDYSKFRTPYFEIEVWDAKLQKRVKLPEDIVRLISKVEITEAFYTSDNSNGGNITLTISEGFDKKPGFITDLIFDNNNNIVSLDSTTLKSKNSPNFVFQERNKIKVTWGYLEDKQNSRSIMKIVSLVQTTFPETGIPTTTITCTDFGTSSADQISTRNGVTFGEKVTLSKNGNNLVVFNDTKTQDVVRNLAKKLNMGVIVSENLQHSTIDKNKQKMWIAGQSFHEFMTRLADLSGCVYSIQTDSTTGREFIIFISKQDYEKRLMLPDVNLLKWKSPGSIVKDLRVSAEFNGLLNNSQKNIDKEGKLIEEDPFVSVPLFTRFDNKKNGTPQQLIDANPIRTNPLPSAEALVDSVAKNSDSDKQNKIVVGTAEINPTESKQSISDRANKKTDDGQRLVQIDFTTIGYPKLSPGIVELGNIGARYSGKYRLINVVHSIDANGYITKCSATSQAIASGGVEPTSPNKGQEIDPLEDVRLFEQAAADPLYELKKFKGLV